MVGVNEVGIRWKDNALIRGGLTDAWVKMNHSMYHDGVKLVVRSQQRLKYPRHGLSIGKD